jgi:hypothetical protein
MLPGADLAGLLHGGYGINSELTRIVNGRLDMKASNRNIVFHDIVLLVA